MAFSRSKRFIGARNRWDGGGRDLSCPYMAMGLPMGGINPAPTYLAFRANKILTVDKKPLAGVD